MAAITISREFGAAGTYIALKTAEALGCTCYDNQILNSIAEKMGKDKSQLEAFDQNTYNRIKVFFHEALESITRGGMVFHPFGVGPIDWDSGEVFATNAPHADKKNNKEYIDVLTQLLKELADESDSVIMGRGGSQILKGHTNVLHVRIVGDMKDKIKRIMDEQNIDESHAIKMIDSWEKTSSNFIYDFFDADIHDPHHYHMILNTSLISPDECVSIIVNAAKKLN